MNPEYDYGDYDCYPDCDDCDCECLGDDDPEEDCECQCHCDRDDVDYDPEYLIDGVGFADPGGRSALRAETRDNPRDCPCPTCGDKNVLTRLDVARGYQCDRCADAVERGW